MGCSAFRDIARDAITIGVAAYRRNWANAGQTFRSAFSCTTSVAPTRWGGARSAGEACRRIDAL